MAVSNGQDRFLERVQTIVDELTLSARWERPSLMMAVYRSEITRKQVEGMLEERLKAEGLHVAHYLVDRQHYDIPRDLRDLRGRARVIVFVAGLQRGGGRGYSNAYRALNMHREFLVEGCVRVIFWLTVSEARQCARFAPDFWSFRHLVVDFADLPAEGETALPEAGIFPAAMPLNDPPGDLQERIACAETLLRMGCLEEALRGFRQAMRKYPQEKAIGLQVAGVQLARQDPAAARRTLKRIPRSQADSVHFLSERDRLERAARAAQPWRGGWQERAG